MKQFLMGADVAYPTALPIADGAIGFTFINAAGVEVVSADGTDILNRANLVLGRTNAKLGPIYVPIHKNRFSYVKGVYSAATTYSAEITIPTPVAKKDYSIIIVKKGVKFNERNKWTSSVHAGAVAPTAAELATALGKHINATKVSHGCSAVVAAAKITITGVAKGMDYELVPADGLFGTAVTQTHALTAYGDAAYVNALAQECAADAGIVYTYGIADQIYPNYPFDALKAAPAVDTGFTIFTFKFAEPRDVKTRDEVVNQTVHVAFPTGAAGIAKFEDCLKSLSGIALPTGV